MDRREFLSLTSGAMLAAGAPALLATGYDDSGTTFTVDRPLKSYGQSCGRYIGVQADKWQLLIPQLAQYIATNFSMLTAGNQFKWGRVRPRPDKFSFDDGDWMLNFTEQHGMRMHGHNLCWNSGNPDWFAKVLNKSNAQKYLTDHIKTVAGRYAGRIDSWDVVNEPVAVWMKRPDGLYPGPWLDLLGPEYIDIAFHATADADPKALRCLNIHHVEEEVDRDEQTRKVSLDLVKQLVKRNVPIQAVGFESHLVALDPMVSKGRDRFVKELRDLGMQILITELDVDDTKIEGNNATRDQAVAKTYHDFLMNIIPSADPKRIIVWTVSDQNNWYDGTHRPMYTRSDAAKHRPGLLDENLGQKVVVNAFADALNKTCRS